MRNFSSKQLALSIVIAVAVFFAFGYWYWTNHVRVLHYSTQKECEAITGQLCSPGNCDYNCPWGYAWKGWVPIRNNAR